MTCMRPFLKASTAASNETHLLWPVLYQRSCNSRVGMLGVDAAVEVVKLPTVLYSNDPPAMPWESWSSRLFDYNQPNSPGTPSDDEHATRFTANPGLSAMAYGSSEVFAAEAFINTDSGYCSEEDADKQDLQYRLLLGGLRLSRSSPNPRRPGGNPVRRTAKPMRKPCKTRYAFQNTDGSRKVPEPHSASQTHSGQSLICSDA